MVFGRSVKSSESEFSLPGEKVTLCTPQMSHYAEWAELRARSRDFLTFWEPTWSRDELTKAMFRRRMRFYSKLMREDMGYPFFLFHNETGSLLGGLNLSNVRRGIIQACCLGYWIGEPYARNGYMTDGVKTVLPFVFQSLNLHRFEAACLENNVASIKLLEKIGFKKEGLARQYMQINGNWQDHLLYALLKNDSRP